MGEQEPRNWQVALEARLKELRKSVIEEILPVAIPAFLFVGGLLNGANTTIQLTNLPSNSEPAKGTVQKQSDLETRLFVDVLTAGTGAGLLLILPLYLRGLFRTKSYTIIVRNAEQEAAEKSSFIKEALGNKQ